MRPDVVVQKEGGEFVNANGSTAWEWGDERGMEAAFADWAAMDAGEVPADPASIVIGSVAFVVECNDGFSPGCHGLPPLAYSRFLEDRWRELTAGARPA